MTESEARILLDEALATVREGPASTFTVRPMQNADARKNLWWSENLKAGESSTTPRSLGYLLGYMRIAGDGFLLASGLPLEGGFLWMDRSVLKRFERDGYVCWSGPADEPRFEITPRGALLFAGRVL